MQTRLGFPDPIRRAPHLVRQARYLPGFEGHHRPSHRAVARSRGLPPPAVGVNRIMRRAKMAPRVLDPPRRAPRRRASAGADGAARLLPSTAARSPRWHAHRPLGGTRIDRAWGREREHRGRLRRPGCSSIVLPPAFSSGRVELRFSLFLWAHPTSQTKTPGRSSDSPAILRPTSGDLPTSVDLE